VFKYSNLFTCCESRVGVLILQGGNFGIDSNFIQKIYEASVSQGFTALAYNFPYYDRGEKSTTDGCSEEAETVKDSIEYLQSNGAENILVVAKSLGSVVATKALLRHPELPVRKVVILGSPIKYCDFTGFKDIALQIIQGSSDKYGDANDVRAALSHAGVEAVVNEIADADHSFRGQNGEEPGEQITAINMINWSIE